MKSTFDTAFRANIDRMTTGWRKTRSEIKNDNLSSPTSLLRSGASRNFSDTLRGLIEVVPISTAKENQTNNTQIIKQTPTVQQMDIEPEKQLKEQLEKQITQIASVDFHLIEPKQQTEVSKIENKSNKKQDRTEKAITSQSWNTSEFLSNFPQSFINASILTNSASRLLSNASSNYLKEDTHTSIGSISDLPSAHNVDKADTNILPHVESPLNTANIRESALRNTEQVSPRFHAANIEQNTSIPEIKQIISAAGNYHDVDKALSIAVAEAESNFNPDAISSDGHYSKGLFQLLDSTGEELSQNLAVDEPYNPFNPRLNAHLGIGYLRQLLDSFSKETILSRGLKTISTTSSTEAEKFAVAAFNTGIGNVARAQKRAQTAGLNPAAYDQVKRFLPDITKRYVEKVIKRKNKLSINNKTTIS